MIVVGSVALSYHKPDVVPNDLDLCGSYDEAVAFAKVFGAKTFYPINSGNVIFMKDAQGRICEFEITWEGSKAAHFHNWFMSSEPGLDGEYYDIRNEWWVPSLNVLYMLKMSHRYLKSSPHHWKTRRDALWMRSQGATIIDNKWFEEHERLTYTNKTPKLNVSKQEFFDGVTTGVHQVYEHDDIHAAIAFLDKPAYTYFKPDENEVFCSKELFFSQPRIVQLYSFVEEAMVLAIERSLVPFPGKKTPREAFDIGMQKITSSIASGWWREAAWEAVDEANALYTDDYVKKFEEGVESGKVRRKQVEASLAV